MSHAGDAPGPGTYYCTNCNKAVMLTEPGEELPACPNCGNLEFEP